MPNSFVVNYIMISVSKLIRDEDSLSNILLVDTNLVTSTNNFIANTFIPLYTTAYANSTMSVESFKYDD